MIVSLQSVLRGALLRVQVIAICLLQVLFYATKRAEHE